MFWRIEGSTLSLMESHHAEFKEERSWFGGTKIVRVQDESESRVGSRHVYRDDHETFTDEKAGVTALASKPKEELWKLEQDLVWGAMPYDDDPGEDEEDTRTWTLKSTVLRPEDYIERAQEIVEEYARNSYTQKILIENAERFNGDYPPKVLS